MENFNATRYKLQNVATKRIFEDEGWTLDDTQSSHPSLIRAVYESQQIHPHGEEHGFTVSPNGCRSKGCWPVRARR